MTLVMIWRESEVERLWVVSDSRLSNRGVVGRVRFTDRAAKILEIPVILRRQTPGDVLGTPIKIMNLGFAFAGSSLVALQAYAAVLPLWSRLQTSGPEILPSVKDFAEHLAHFVECFASEFAFSQGAAVSRCQCALIGWCEAAGKLDGYLIEIRPSVPSLSVKLDQLRIFGSDPFQTLGSAGDQASEELVRTLGADENVQLRREPLKFIRQFVRNAQHDAVGGGVQIGWANSGGFQLLFDVQPFPGSSFPDMRYHGFSFNEINQIGDAFINLPGLA
jgi:hypothetical protein